MNDKILLDSNLLVYAVDQSDKEKYEIAQKIFNECLNGKNQYFLSLQNISEFYVIITKKIQMPIDKQVAAEICKKIMEFDGFIKLNHNKFTLIRAMQLEGKIQGHYWDCLIAATMIENNVLIVYTENTKHFDKIPGIKAVNPFK